jgi:hypothetical protein
MTLTAAVAPRMTSLDRQMSGAMDISYVDARSRRTAASTNGSGAPRLGHIRTLLSVTRSVDSGMREGGSGGGTSELHAHQACS